MASCEWPIGRGALAAMQLFRIKICGITRAEDARAAAEMGADAIGLNFVTGSPRCLGVEEARRLVSAMPESLVRVGVFAGASVEAMHKLAEAAGLDAIQLHGELWPAAEDCGQAAVPVDPPQRCAELRPLPVIRAVHLGAAEGPEPNRLADANRWAEEARKAGAAPAMLLVDASVARETAAAARGGTGRTVDWAGVASAQADLPVAVAGGLKPENVAEAIAVSSAVAVDVASGVESAPGLKDLDKLRLFISQAAGVLPPLVSG